MELLVLGANGLLGSNVVETALDRDWSVAGTYHSTEPALNIPLSQLDITDTSETTELLESHDPDWVVNCAAMTDVDDCESNPELAHTVNAVAPGEIAAHCAKTGTCFLHVSTDYVFDGQSSSVYEETDGVNPVQVYGESKLAGEQRVRKELETALIPRLSFVYGIHRASRKLTGIPAWVRDQIQDGKEVPLFTDQHVTPSRAGQTAATFCDLIDVDIEGTLHIASRSCVSPYEFGHAISKMMNGDTELLVEGSMADVTRMATRPPHTCLDVSKVEQVLGRQQPTLDADLDEISAWLDDSKTSQIS